MPVQPGPRLAGSIEESCWWRVPPASQGSVLGTGVGRAATWETVLQNSFTNRQTLEASWNYRYPPHLPIHYQSGAMHAKQQVLVNDQFPNWEVKGEFQAPSARGTWPAFLLTGATSWPPESDILEFKGDGRNWFNTYKNASGAWSNTIVPVSNPGGWHGYRAWLAKVNATDD